MTRTLLAALAGTFVLLGEASAATYARQDLTIVVDDGAPIAATLYLPDSAPPEGGWPAIVLLHGLGADRTQTNAIAETYGLAGEDFAVLTYDARGHGASGGLSSIAGPREVADAGALYTWLSERPEVAAERIGAWGISAGGATILNSFLAGAPWAAVFAAATWTDLPSVLVPQGLVRPDLVAALVDSVAETRRDPSLVAVQAAALAGNTEAVRTWAEARSSLAGLEAVTSPVFLAQGRRDPLFGLAQGSLAFQRLQGTKALWVGLHGSSPSAFPAADTALLMGQVRAWYDCHLRGAACDPARQAVFVAPERFTGQVVRTAALPRTSTATFALPGVATFAARGKAVRQTRPLPRAIEVFGTPSVQVSAAASGGWARLVAVLTARTRQGQEIVLATGGVPTRAGAQRLTIQLTSQATVVPRGARLTLTLAASAVTQTPVGQPYLDLPMRPNARVRVGTAVLRLPALRTPVTR